MSLIQQNYLSHEAEFDFLNSNLNLIFIEENNDLDNFIDIKEKNKLLNNIFIKSLLINYQNNMINNGTYNFIRKQKQCTNDKIKLKSFVLNNVKLSFFHLNEYSFYDLTQNLVDQIYFANINIFTKESYQSEILKTILDYNFKFVFQYLNTLTYLQLISYIKKLANSEGADKLKIIYIGNLSAILDTNYFKEFYQELYDLNKLATKTNTVLIFASNKTNINLINLDSPINSNYFSQIKKVLISRDKNNIISASINNKTRII